jgi:hypothetical protein
MSINEAFQDFWDYMHEPPDYGALLLRWDLITAQDRSRIRVARHTAQGKVKRNGKVLPLGARQLESILSKFAPGRYRFDTVIHLNT